MDKNIEKIIERMIGEPCCLKRVWRGRSLSLGFGKKIFHNNPKLIDEFNGEWNFRTYFFAWRIIAKERIVCASQDVANSIDELNTALNQIQFGQFSAVYQLGDMDVRVELNNDIVIDFLATTSDEDEGVTLFCPDHICIHFSIGNGWQLGRSDKPWRPVPN